MMGEKSYCGDDQIMMMGVVKEQEVNKGSNAVNRPANKKKNK